MLSEQKIEEYRRNLNGAGWLQGLLFSRLLKQIEELAEDSSPLAIAALAETVAIKHPRKAQQIAWQALDQFSSLGPNHILELVRVYCQTEEPLLAKLIVKHGWLPVSPTELRLEVALKTGLTKPLYDDGPETVIALLRIAQSEDKTKKQPAEKVLLSLKNQESQDEVCRLAIEDGLNEALRLVLSADYLPSNPQLKALFLFLKGQFDKYNELDFDQRWLKSYYQTGNAELRRQIAQKIREAGRIDYLEIIRVSTHPEGKTRTDWTLTIEVLRQQERWPELWALVKEVPLRWCKQILQDWPATAWQPDDPAFEHLCYLARQCGSVNVPLGHLYNSPYNLNLRDYFNCPYQNMIFLNNEGEWLVSSNNDVSGTLLLKLNSRDKHPTEEIQVSQAVYLPNIGKITSNALLEVVTTSDFRLIKTKDGEVVALFGRNADSYYLYCPDTDYAISGDNQKLVIKKPGEQLQHYYFQLWDLTNNQLITTLQLPDRDKNYVVRGYLDTTIMAFSQAGDRFFCEINGNKVYTWNLPNPEAQSVVDYNGLTAKCTGFDPQGNIIALGLESHDANPNLLINNLTTGQTISQYHEPQLPKTLIFSHDSQTLIGVYCDGQILPPRPARMRYSNWNLQLRSLSDQQVVTTPLSLLENRSYVFEALLTKQGQVFILYGEDNYPDGYEQLRIYEFWLVEFIEREQIAITQEEWARIETTLASGAEMLPSERNWLEFCEALLRWNRRHEIELDDRPPVTPQEFDIEL